MLLMLSENGFPEILQVTSETSTTKEVQAIVHQPDIPELDLEVKLELVEEEEGGGNVGEGDDEIEELSEESAARSLLLLSQSQQTFEPSRFKSLWEGIFHYVMRYPKVVITLILTSLLEGIFHVMRYPKVVIILNHVN